MHMTHHDTLPKLSFCSPCARCQVLIITRPGALGLRTLPTLPTLLVEQNILFLWESICGFQTDNNTVSFLITTLPVVKESHRTCSTYRRPHMSFSICLVGWLVGWLVILGAIIHFCRSTLDSLRINISLEFCGKNTNLTSSTRRVSMGIQFSHWMNRRW